MIETIAWLGGLGSLMGVVGFVFTSTRANDSKVNRVYERLDLTKKDHDASMLLYSDKVENTYVHKDVCAITNKYTKDKLDTIDSKVDRVEHKIDTLLANGRSQT